VNENGLDHDYQIAAKYAEFLLCSLYDSCCQMFVFGSVLKIFNSKTATAAKASIRASGT